MTLTLGDDCVHGLRPEWCSICSGSDARPLRQGQQGGPKQRPDTQMADLVALGYLPIGARLSGTHKGSTYEAVVQSDGGLLHNGHFFGSPSGAASAVTGTSVNGWIWWYFEGLPLSDLRARHLS